MVVKMMKWRPWPPIVSRKYEVRLIVRSLEGCDLVRDSADKGGCEVCKLAVEIRWKGPKLTLSSLRRTAVARNFTKEVEVNPVNHNGIVEWDEEFQSLCNLSAYKDNVFHPWEIAFTVFNVGLFFSLSFSCITLPPFFFPFWFVGIWGLLSECVSQSFMTKGEIFIRIGNMSQIINMFYGFQFFHELRKIPSDITGEFLSGPSLWYIRHFVIMFYGFQFHENLSPRGDRFRLGLNQRPKNKVPVVGTASLNLAEYASVADQKDFELNVPLSLPGAAAEQFPSLCIWVSLVELRAAQESVESVQRSIVSLPSPSQSGESTSTDKDELSAIKAGLRKVKILTEYVSTRKTKKACPEEEGSESRGSARSEDGDYNYPFDSDSLDDFEEGESDEVKEGSNVRKSFSYGTLAYANYAGGSFYSSMRVNGDDEDLVYYSNRKSDVGSSQMEDSTEPSVFQSSKRSILPWRKRKLSFRSPKAKGEPLLKKAYAEEGGDDIDFDRRQLSSDESLGLYKTEDDSYANRSSISEFGDDNFAIGCWEQKEVTSRDGHMKLQTQVFFASIDQRSERAAGESACTALVAVIADWFQNNHDLMPIKSQFDSLIREGSLEWRNLCENVTYMERFPDKHFDLDTVIQAKIRPLSVVSGKSFIGFFQPEGMDEGRFDFLRGAMSFDNIWDEISQARKECPSNAEPQLYIVSWNDHFFILKVEADAYYIIDTLGERLYEGCNQAYILKFDSSTVISKVQNVAQSSDEKTASDQQTVASILEQNNNKQAQQINSKELNSAVELEKLVKKEEEEEEIVCRGKEACKEYIKSFLAAIPIRELQADIKKGLISSTPLHRRLQIELHYTQLLPSLLLTPAAEASLPAPEETLALALTEVYA